MGSCDSQFQFLCGNVVNPAFGINECDGYLHSSTILKVFVEQFDNAMRNKVENEILSDFECFKGKLEHISYGETVPRSLHPCNF